VTIVVFSKSKNMPSQRDKASSLADPWVWLAVCAVVASTGCDAVAPGRSASKKPDAQPPAAQEQIPDATGPIRLADVTSDSGITFQHTDGGSGVRYLVETVSAGIALLDYDGDGLIDIYFINGAPLPPGEADMSVTNALYRNEGDLKFRDVTQRAGVDDAGFGLGVVSGDFDGDGDVDLYLNNFGPNVLYANNGDGTFTNITDQAGVACDELVGAGTVLLDADRDGDLDLYVANYIQFSFELHQPRTIDGYPCYPGPLDYEPAHDVLYRNDGNGTFTDVSDAAGVSQVAGTGMGMVCADYDNDRDTDILVVNDELPNLLLENDGNGRFTDVAITRGVAFDLQGKPQGSMGVDCGDFDNDGWLDFFATSFSREMPTLYHNQNGRFFEDATLTSGAGSRALPHVNWGTAFGDLDNDGWLDLMVACGHIDQQVHRWNPSTAFRVPNLVLHNRGDGRFEDVSRQAGSGLLPRESSRGLGIDDLDNDGDLDVVVLNSRARPTIMRNDSTSQNSWVQIELIAKRPNRSAVGSQVRLTANDTTRLAEVHAGRGYQSHHGSRLHFGLGAAQRIDRVEVAWMAGAVEVFENLPTNRRLVLIEGGQWMAR
jgi:hypothetical protein